MRKRQQRTEHPILQYLEKEFERLRDKTPAPFPYDSETNEIHLPYEIESELRHLVLTGRKIEAMRRVLQLTGASLRIAKDYVDSLVEA
ncbi:MAG: hypothetical protein N2559_06915 [Anaerolineae bacterium]|nr:hypothetical protein [Anaerolineae bacterium]